MKVSLPEGEDGQGPVGLVWPPVPDGHPPKVISPHAQPARLPRPGDVPVVDDGRHVVMDKVALKTVDVYQHSDHTQHCFAQGSHRQKLWTSWKWRRMFKVRSC